MNVMGNVGLRDTVSGETSNPSHEGTKFTEEITVHGSEGTTRESEFSRTVVRKEGIGMLKESDQHEPVVHPEIRNEIQAENLEEAPGVDTVTDGGQPENNTNIREDDLAPLMFTEDDSFRVKVICANGITLLTGSISGNVRRPTDQKKDSWQHQMQRRWGHHRGLHTILSSPPQIR